MKNENTNTVTVLNVIFDNKLKKKMKKVDLSTRGKCRQKLGKYW